MKKQTIAVDIDDVLSASVQSWVEFSNKKWVTRLTIEDYTEDWALMWGVDQEEGKRRAHEIYNSGVVRSFSRFEDAEAVLRELSKHHDLVITTSRVKYVRKDTMEWIDEHFKDVFKEVYLAGFYDSDHADPVSMTKGELAKSIGANYLIDDQLKHCEAAAKVGIEALLFGDYPWNRDIKKLPPGVNRVLDWHAVKAYFDAK